MISPHNKIIDIEFDMLLEKLKHKHFFALSRFNDGEMHVIKKAHFSSIGAGKQWQLSQDAYDEFRKSLAESLTYNHKNYYVGLPCGCCESLDGFRAHLRDEFNLSETNQTFATLFTNAMYQRVQKELIPQMKQYPIVLITNEETDIKSLENQGFNIKKFFPIPMNAWQKHDLILQEILGYIKENNTKNHLFLFCAGPVSNVLIHQIHHLHPHNTYIDFGSSMDKELGLKDSARNYLSAFGWKKLAKCYWDYPTQKNQISCYSKDKTKLYRFWLKIRALFLP